MTGPEAERLVFGLSEAFTVRELEQLLLFKMARRLELFVQTDASTVDVAFDLVRAAIREGWERDLIKSACLFSNPVRPAMQTFCEEFPHLAPGGAISPSAERPDLLSDIRQRLLLTTDDFEIRRLMYELEAYLAVQPHSVEGKLLLFQIRRVLTKISLPKPVSRDTEYREDRRGPSTRLAILICLCFLLGIAIVVLLWQVSR